MPMYTTRSNRSRSGLMNWRVLAVGALALVLVLSLQSDRVPVRGSSSLRTGQYRPRVDSTRAAMEAEERRPSDTALGADHQAEVQEVEELKGTIEQPEGTAGVLQQKEDDKAMDESSDKVSKEPQPTAKQQQQEQAQPEAESQPKTEAVSAQAAEPSKQPKGTAAPLQKDAPEKPAPDKKKPGSCLADQPWIQPALDVFFQHPWRSANQSLQSSEEALQAINNITWHNGYRPGHDEIHLHYEAATGRYKFEINEIAKPNLQYKKDCILEILKGAIEAHNEELVEALAKRDLKFIVATEDFGLVWRGNKWKLPTFALCTDDNMIDIPVPDFTYVCYPETRYKNSSWPAIRELLYRKSQMVNWEDRKNDIFHRSHWGVGPRQKLMPLFMSYQNSSRDVDAFGAHMNVGDTGFSPHFAKRDTYVFLDQQCDHRYQIHTAGFSYSAGLKYKLACGSLVFKFESTFKEFYEPALKDGVHVVKLKEDPGVFESETVPRMKEVVSSSQGSWPDIAQQGQDFVMRNLTIEALHCYWYGALVRYSELFFLESTPRQLEEQQQQKQREQQQQQAKEGEQGGGVGKEQGAGTEEQQSAEGQQQQQLAQEERLVDEKKKQEEKGKVALQPTDARRQ